MLYWLYLTFGVHAGGSRF